MRASGSSQRCGLLVTIAFACISRPNCTNAKTQNESLITISTDWNYFYWEGGRYPENVHRSCTEIYENLIQGFGGQSVMEDEGINWGYYRPVDDILEVSTTNWTEYTFTNDSEYGYIKRFECTDSRLVGDIVYISPSLANPDILILYNVSSQSLIPGNTYNHLIPYWHELQYQFSQPCLATNGSHLFMIGGYAIRTDPIEQFSVSTVFIYDIQNDVWSIDNRSTMNQTRYRCQAQYSSYHDVIYVVGGFYWVTDDTDSVIRENSDTIEYYDLEEQKWYMLEQKLDCARILHSSLLLETNRDLFQYSLLFAITGQCDQAEVLLIPNDPTEYSLYGPTLVSPVSSESTDINSSDEDIHVQTVNLRIEGNYTIELDLKNPWGGLVQTQFKWVQEDHDTHEKYEIVEQDENKVTIHKLAMAVGGTATETPPNRGSTLLVNITYSETNIVNRTYLADSPSSTDPTQTTQLTFSGPFSTQTEANTLNSSTLNTIGTTETAGGDEGQSAKEKFLSVLERVVLDFVYSVSLLGLFLIVLSVCYYYCVGDGSDPPNLMAIGKFFASLIDFWTDLGFSLSLFLESEIALFVFAICFTLVPYLLSCVLGIYWLERWRGRLTDNKHLKRYLKHSDALLIVFTVVAGFFSAVNLCQSKLFYMSYFCLPLKSKYQNALKNAQFAVIVCLENLPQLIIQLIHMRTKLNGLNGVSNELSDSPLLFISMAFSLLSVFSAVLAQASRCCQHRKIEEKKFDLMLNIDGRLKIESTQLRHVHAFAYNVLNQWLQAVFDDKMEQRNDFIYNAEVHFIEKKVLSSISGITAFFNLKVYFFFGNKDVAPKFTAMFESFNKMFESVKTSKAESDKKLDLMKGLAKLLRITCDESMKIGFEIDKKQIWDMNGATIEMRVMNETPKKGFAPLLQGGVSASSSQPMRLQSAGSQVLNSPQPLPKQADGALEAKPVQKSVSTADDSEGEGEIGRTTFMTQTGNDIETQQEESDTDKSDSAQIGYTTGDGPVATTRQKSHPF